jgi:hypothetical protein
MCKENIDLVLDRSARLGQERDEWAKLWHPDTRVTVSEEQPEFLFNQLKET